MIGALLRQILLQRFASLFRAAQRPSIWRVRWWRSTILTCTLLVCGLAGQALALGPENLLLIVNKNVPESARIAEHYAQARHVPAGRILALDLPTGDEIPFEQYESRVIPAIRAHLRDNHLKSEVTCLVTFYGVPLRIGARKETLESKQEIAGLEKELADVARQLLPTVQRADKVLILEHGQIVEFGPRKQLADDPDSRFAQLLRTGMEEALA